MSKSNTSWIRFALFLTTLLMVSLSSFGSVLAEGGSGENCGSRGLMNPLSSCSVQEFLFKIIDIILVFALPIIVLFIMYGGFLLVTAQGEPTKLKTGRDAILYAVIGGVIVLGAKIIVEIIKTTVQSL